MTQQTFHVILRITANVESSGKPYLTETRVRRQIEKFLKPHRMCDGLPCHGSSTIQVAEVIELDSVT